MAILQRFSWGEVCFPNEFFSIQKQKTWKDVMTGCRTEEKWEVNEQNERKKWGCTTSKSDPLWRKACSFTLTEWELTPTHKTTMSGLRSSIHSCADTRNSLFQRVGREAAGVWLADKCLVMVTYTSGVLWNTPRSPSLAFHHQPFPSFGCVSTLFCPCFAVISKFALNYWSSASLKGEHFCGVKVEVSDLAVSG